MVNHWIWYPGDFEIYHGMIQNFSREERGFRWPAYYYIDDCRKHVKFSKTYMLKEKTRFVVHSHAYGYIRINDVKQKFEEVLECNPGENVIEVFAGMPSGVPAILVEGDVVHSDDTWEVTDFVSEPVAVGYNSLYIRKEQNPSVWEYKKREYRPDEIKEVQNGVLLQFETEVNATLKMTYTDTFHPFTVCYGESIEEALDVENCYYSQHICTTEDEIPRRAFRYLFIPEMKPGEIEITAIDLYVDMPSIANFYSSDEMMNQIWNVSEKTFQLCSEIFFIDGVKRDRWIWSGDAYQSYFVNQYLMFDEEINKRTMWALRGNDPIRQHINTIVDYSMYWLISIYKHYEMTGDKAFVKAIYPKMLSMMEFLEKQLDPNGFLVGRKDDWIFVDWAEIDKEGAVCAEQILFAECYRIMSKVSETDENYKNKYLNLISKIKTFYWDEELGAYIDSFQSGKKHVSRHTNIFAVLFGIAEDTQREKIFEQVLMNKKVPAITTPYFKFYELEALSLMGKKSEVRDTIKDYWGGMLKRGAVTFWEEFDPEQHGAEQYAMYGDPFGKSLCHAWAASPIYLIGRYFMGIKLTSIAYETFEVAPDTSLFETMEYSCPIKGGIVQIKWDEKQITVMTDKDGGVLKYHEKVIPLEKGKETILDK